MNYYQTRPSQNSDSFQSIYSYDNMDNLSSRKITKRGLRILKSRDTLDKQRPVKIRTRRRKALLIGINYVNKPYELHGCINDARYIYSFLKENYDFKEENCRILTEDADDESLIPTKKNIINSMKWLVSGAKPGDSLFFHYSGHGLSFVDEDGDEIDGLDESILPVDYETNGVILDDEIHDLLVKPLPKGCLLTALADCCHSGTVLDLPYSYNSDGELECIDDMDRQHKEISKEYLSNEVYKKNKMVQNLINRNTSPPPIYLSLRERSTIDSYIKQTRKSSANVIQYSSCRDNEISADERANGNNYGALCNAFVSTLTNLILEEKTISYCELLKELTSIIQKRYGQTPQLTTGRPMDVHQPFEI
ncbi:peptidase C14 [Piromyces finnis]|uniref:Peptidase C14 n=1 Tax=Piromyces finnis TaxID=1754191 RepID=A0A1Y1UN49_9FUNG|nr:peptidase C14 [Piromyces finnis]|eukprot:ORX39480.1 peptidase C14 [Piromyces finnis]